jgi:MOSC domain-containing protein YiiM
MFGENVTTTGVEVDGALIGERWQIGDEVVLEVCGPRIPCATFQARMGERGWIKRFTAVGNSGAYLSVIASGTVRHGDFIQIIHRPSHSIDVRRSFQAFSGDAEAAAEVVAAACMHEPDHKFLVGRLNRRSS